MGPFRWSLNAVTKISKVNSTQQKQGEQKKIHYQEMNSGLDTLRDMLDNQTPEM
jgi:hypothetical protein